MLLCSPDARGVSPIVATARINRDSWRRPRIRAIRRARSVSSSCEPRLPHDSDAGRLRSKWPPCALVVSVEIWECIPQRSSRRPIASTWETQDVRRSPTSSFSPDFACHGIPGFLHQGGDLLLPTRLLASEEADRHLQGSTGIVERESAAPSLRDVGKVFFGEGLGDSPHPVAGKRGAEGQSYELRQESGRIQDPVRPPQETDTHHAQPPPAQPAT